MWIKQCLVKEQAKRRGVCGGMFPIFWTSILFEG